MRDSSAQMRSLRSSGSSSSICLHENWLPLAPQLLEPLLRSPEAIQSSTACDSPGNLQSRALVIWPLRLAPSISHSVRKNLSHGRSIRVFTSRLAECACSSGPS
jgi:hypothetical protein